ncbi:MAG: ABC transporter ATP-binding protein, partial [Clostridia bacterium]|nr:ABC transporter ATP-binding protein [Clostridia bacterium]
MGVEDVNLELNVGEAFGFIGPNGAGKSTTIRAILNLINKTSGEVFFDGKKLSKADVEIKKQIGYLPSEVNLYEDLTVKEMLDFHEKFYDKDLSHRRKELSERLKLDETKKIEDLSLGQNRLHDIALQIGNVNVEGCSVIGDRHLGLVIHETDPGRENHGPVGFYRIDV